MISVLPELLQRHPWLADPGLEACVVGSTALHIACERAGLPPPPRAADLDLAWRLSPDEGRAVLAAQGISATSTPAAEARGTLGAVLDGQRVEITSFRGGGGSFVERLVRDAQQREATIGALFVALATSELHDPLDGLSDWQEGTIRACGDPEARLREHPIRALRYLRRSTELGFVLEVRSRRAIHELANELAPRIEPEAMAEELRRVLLHCSSPGVFFQRMQDERLLAPLLPELAALFDGRPAGRVQHHPELSLGLHMILVLKEAAALCTRDRATDVERLALLLAVLCHDLGKGLTPASEWPSHPGHEQAGVPLVAKLWQRLPGLADKRVRRLCETVAQLHLLVLHLRELRPGTLVTLWEDTLGRQRQDFALIARAARCDRAGRLQRADLGLPDPPHAPRPEDPEVLEQRVLDDLRELDRIVRSVDGAPFAQEFGHDPALLRRRLHDARVQALREADFTQRGAG